MKRGQHGTICPTQAIQELDDTITEFQGHPRALIPVLNKVQDLYGYIPKDAQRRVAQGLKIPLREVYHAASFYSFYSLVPQGRYKIEVCMNRECYRGGAEEVLVALEQALGIKAKETTSDGRFSLDLSSCFDCCSAGPAIRINGKVHAGLTPEAVPDILQQHE